MLCLMMTLPIFSQKLSNDSIKCVPVSALRNAVIMKTEFEKCKISLSESRDSVFILNKIVSSQDTLINIKTQKISILEDNVKNLNDVIVSKDGIIDEKNKQIKKYKKQTFVGYGVGFVSILLSLLIVL